MPVEAKPLFRPDVLRPHLSGFELSSQVMAARPQVERWAELLNSTQGDSLKETELLPDFFTLLFCDLLGYTRPVDGGDRYTLSREQHVEVDGKFADAVLGRFTADKKDYIVAVEGKGPRDPLDVPFAGRRMSAVDQGYRYAINLKCDWMVVTSMRQTRLYSKGADQRTYESFDIDRLANDEGQLKKLVFLLGAERVVPAAGRCHLYDLHAASEKVGRDLTKQFYVRYGDMRQDALDHLCRANPAVPREQLLSCTQKLLDRVLFCAFCEDRGLLPADSIRKAWEHRDPYHPRPIWENFRGLFRAIDQGNTNLNIPAYNGGLFAPNTLLDGLNVPDAVCTCFRDLAEYDYRPAYQVALTATPAIETRGPATNASPAANDERALIDVDILGHIFEQSITDLELLRNELEGLSPALGKEKHKTRRKKEGAFYTPAFITRYIVEQTLGGVLADRFERLRETHVQRTTGTAAKSLADPRVYDLDAINKPQRETLVKFWEAWQDELATIRVLDPACGSGAFLIEAFDQLHAAYQVVNDRIEELRGHRTLFDLDRQILQNNLYGVDLNAEAIEICRLSLWIKTAQRGKVLTSLDHSICEGNSVVSDPAVHPKAFDWHAAFPEVFANGGFDIVVGNPPYIRQEWLAPYKPHWERCFQSYHGVADIFTYFFEVGSNLLRSGGRLGFITSGSWVRGNFGAPLRRFLSSNLGIESMIDFGEF
ncbi:MAG: Eco57I restriction-modification methylase domain-containing protein [Planctomycetales bacterium]